jgi:hypothetical protein
MISANAVFADVAQWRLLNTDSNSTSALPGFWPFSAFRQCKNGKSRHEIMGIGVNFHREWDIVPYFPNKLYKQELVTYNKAA